MEVYGCRQHTPTNYRVILTPDLTGCYLNPSCLTGLGIPHCVDAFFLFVWLFACFISLLKQIQTWHTIYIYLRLYSLHTQVLKGQFSHVYVNTGNSFSISFSLWCVFLSVQNDPKHFQVLPHVIMPVWVSKCWVKYQHFCSKKNDSHMNSRRMYSG